jgi:hypothetical protein
MPTVRQLLDSAQGAANLIPLLNREIEEKFRSLLETKHLYQKVEIDWRKIIEELQERVIPAYHSQFIDNIRGIDNMPFAPATQVGIVAPQGNLGQVPLVLLLKNVTMFCRVCDRREAYRPIWHRNLSAELVPVLQSRLIRHLPLPGYLQDFALVYQCQSCEGVPETLIVRRERWTLSLNGRSPMASVETAAYIPKKERDFLRDAIIAHGSGKTLAGLFYLRTFIEQFGRRITGLSGRETGDEIFSAYSETLPANVRDSMPSLAEWYGKLSVALHAADSDEGLFKDAQEKIEKHFEIRKAMDISEISAKTNERSAAPNPAK